MQVNNNILYLIKIVYTSFSYIDVSITILMTSKYKEGASLVPL